MCHELVLSTQTNLDLTQFNTNLLEFSKDLPESPFVEKLNHSEKWYVGSRTGCSCGFRHLTHPELGFGPPVAWDPESDEDIAATLEFLKVVHHLTALGAAVDCVDYWSTSPIADYQVLKVDLHQQPGDHFRFFENHHFIFEHCDPM